MDALSANVLEKLRTFDTPTICNLIELFEVRARTAGYMDGRIVAAFPAMVAKPVVGYAATATFRAAAAARSGDSYAGLPAQVERFGELSGPAFVVFHDVDDPVTAATFGEVMCSVYKGFGAVGLITSGAGRDLDQVEAITFPVWTNGTICAHGYCHTPEVHVPVRVGGCMIYPNDLLHADRNGVTTIPHEIAAEMADIGDEFVDAEHFVLDAVRAPNPTVAALKEAQAAMAAQVTRIRQQVSRAAAIR